MYNTQLQCPFSAIISGGSGTGKTTLLFNLLQCQEYLFSEKPAKTFLFYKKYQNMYDELLRLKLVQELIEIEDEMISETEFTKLVSPYKDIGGSLALFDDCQDNLDATNSKIFTKIAHHENCNTIFLTQCLFLDNKHYRVMSRNATYIIVMKNPRDVSQIKHFSSQIGLSDGVLIGAYKEATKKAYSYLLMDFHPTTPDHIRLRSSIFPNETPMTVYMHKNSV